MTTAVSEHPAGAASSSSHRAGEAATVVGVHPTATEATTVVSLQLGDDDAQAVAAAAQTRLLMVSAGGE